MHPLLRSATIALLASLAGSSSCHGDAAPSPAPAPAPVVDADLGRSSIVSVAPEPALGCPALQPYAQFGAGTQHAPRVTGNETWTAEGSPHRLPLGLTIEAGGSLTLAPCACVLVAPERAITVGARGALFSMGESARPVLVTLDGPMPRAGAWRGVRFEHDARPTSRFVFTTIAYAGGEAEPNARGCIIDAMPDLDLMRVSLIACAGTGVAWIPGGSFANATDAPSREAAVHPASR